MWSRSTQVARSCVRVSIVDIGSTAEMAKLLENTTAAVNIGLINRIWRSWPTNSRSTSGRLLTPHRRSPSVFSPSTPGQGSVGTASRSIPSSSPGVPERRKFATRFIDLAEQVNTEMPKYTAERIAELLNRQGLPVFGRRSSEWVSPTG